ncbi:L,D-transpeptidase family protein [Flavimaricola marinus]|nr:L,D-transpeptidase family protein [Flavimaricola marinus]
MIAACGSSDPRFLTYRGPDVTSVLVYKGQRKMQLMHNNTMLKSYRFELGFAPTGHKRIEGDGRTPEGQYWIDRRNPNSRFHLSLGISYPNANDRAVAQSMGMPPGGDIFIHGTPDRYRGQDDWTWGCIAVSNREIEEIYSMVRDGTPIYIWA